jgi:hypothetical protein
MVKRPAPSGRAAAVAYRFFAAARPVLAWAGEAGDGVQHIGLNPS